MAVLSIRGHKVNLFLVVNGVRLDIEEFTNFEFASNTESQEDFYIGKQRPEIDTLERGWSGSFTMFVKSRIIDDEIEKIINARQSQAPLPDVVIVLVEEYNNNEGQLIRAFQECQLMYSNYRTGGVNEKVTKTIAFTSPIMVLD